VFGFAVGHVAVVGKVLSLVALSTRRLGTAPRLHLAPFEVLAKRMFKAIVLLTLALTGHSTHWFSC